MAEVTGTKRQVVAKPTYNQPRYGQAFVVRGGNIAHDTQQLLRGLSQLEPALVGVLENHQKRQAQAQAAQDVAEGKAPQSRLNVYLDSYNQLNAYSKAGDFAKSLNEWANDPNMSLGNWETNVSSGLDEMIKDQEPGFVQRFVPMALQAIQKADATFTDNFKNRERDKHLSKIGRTIANTAQGLMHNEEAKPEDNANALRQWLDQLQNTGKGLNLSTKEVSEAVLDRIGYIAVENGRPDLLDYVKIKDKSGVSVEDAFPEKAFNYRNRAKNAREQMDKDATTARDKWETMEKNKQMNALMIEMAEVNTADVNAMKNLRMRLYGLKDAVKASEFRPLINAFDALRDNIGFAHRTDQSVWATLYTDAKNGRLNWEKLQESLGRLTSDDFREIIKAQAQHLASTYDKAAAEDQKLDKKALDWSFKRVIKEEFGDAEGYAKGRWIETVYHEFKDDWRKQNPNQYMSLETRKDLSDKAFAEVESWDTDFGEPMVQRPGKQVVPKKGTTSEERSEDEAQEAERLLNELKPKKE